jgi:hypothetical protein
MYRNNISFCKCAERFVVIVMGNLLLINTYLTKITNEADICIIQSVLEEIGTVINNFPSLDIVWGGDFNLDLLKYNIHLKIFDNFSANIP